MPALLHPDVGRHAHVVEAAGDRAPRKRRDCVCPRRNRRRRRQRHLSGSYLCTAQRPRRTPTSPLTRTCVSQPARASAPRISRSPTSARTPPPAVNAPSLCEKVWLSGNASLVLNRPAPTTTNGVTRDAVLLGPRSTVTLPVIIR